MTTFDPDTATPREQLIEIVTRDPQPSGGDETWATDLVDAYRAEVIREVTAQLKQMTLLADDCGCIEALNLLATGWLPNGGHDSLCGYASGITGRCTCEGADR